MTKSLSYQDQLMQQLHEKKLTAKGKQCEVAVSLVPNLLLVGYAKSASWVFRYKDPINKKWTAKTIGNLAEVSVTEAVNRASIMRDAVAAGNSPRQSVITVAAYFDECYYPQAVAAKKRSIADDRSRFNCHVRVPWAAT